MPRQKKEITEKKPKKPLLKRWWFWVLVVLIVIVATSSGSNKNSSAPTASTEAATDKPTEAPTEAPTDVPTEAPTEVPTDAPTEAPTATPEPSRKDVITSAISGHIGEQYVDTDITSITINDDLGTDTADDYIALVRLTWNVKNSGATSKEMLSMYSSDLAAYVAKECPDVQEIAIFWTVPYLNDANAKCSYERKGENMYEMDMMWPSVFDAN